MELRNKVTVVMFFAVIGLSIPAYAAWQGPVAIISGTWGTNNDQFGIEYNDVNDRFPTQIFPLIDGGLIVGDIVNGRREVYTADGTLKKLVQCAKDAAGEWNGECRIVGDFIQTGSDGNIWTGPEYLKQQGYTLYSTTGQVIKTSITRPVELGKVKETALGNGKYEITVTYPDRVWNYTGAGMAPPYVRDIKGNLYSSGGTQAVRWNFCGRELARLTLPPPKTGEDYEEYGQAVVGPNGDVYTWKRTPDSYSILKWTWVDDPNVPNGPDAPTSLSIMPSTTGLYLTWTASLQDPGCVTGYEVSRATSTGGAGSTVATVNKGVVKYNDTTATVGTAYYYKIRAMAGSEYSPYTSEVSGKR